jgi:rubrerythrin
MTKQRTIGDFLDLAIAAERDAEMFYLGLAKRFNQIPELRYYWTEFALEEAGHVKWITYFRDSLSPQQLGVIAKIPWAEVWADPKFQGDNLLMGVRTVNDAFEKTHALEFGITNALFRLFMDQFPNHPRTQEFIQIYLQQHINRLVTDFPQPFKDGITRRSIFAAEDVNAGD